MTSTESLLSALRQDGFRITPQREMIVAAIADSDGHTTADDVLARVRTKTQALNLATVYRTLELLVGEGLISRADLGEGRIVYATAGHGQHLHLVCRRCGRVIEADPDLLEPMRVQIALQHGFQPDVSHVPIFGLCSDCAPGGSD